MISRIAPLVLALAPALSTAAGGAWDGIYSCGVTVAGLSDVAYITVNGQPDGRAIFAVGAVAPTTNLYGYGIGAIAGNVFSGTTMFGAPFRMTQNGTGFSGTAGVLLFGTIYTASANCSKIW